MVPEVLLAFPVYCSLALSFVLENVVTHLLFQCENLHLVLDIFHFFPECCVFPFISKCLALTLQSMAVVSF